MNLAKLLVVMGVISLIGFVTSRVYWDGKQKDAENRVMTAYIDKNKDQILNLKSSDSLACNKNECLASFNSLQESIVLTKEDETFFKDGQYYIFNKNKDGKIEYTIIKNKEEIEKNKEIVMLLSTLSVMM